MRPRHGTEQLRKSPESGISRGQLFRRNGKEQERKCKKSGHKEEISAVKEDRKWVFVRFSDLLLRVGVAVDQVAIRHHELAALDRLLPAPPEA